MRKMILIVLSLLVFLPGCGFFDKKANDEVNFYYLQTEYDYRSESGLIGSEQREVAGHRNNLSYLLALYQMGPSGDSLKLPFPGGTSVTLAEQTQDEIKLVLTTGTKSLSAIDFSVASACLTLTCTELTGAETVTVTWGEQSISMTRDMILLYDSSMSQSTEEIK